MKVDRRVYPDAAQAAEACGRDILTNLQAAIQLRGNATLAISGGTTPALMFRSMARQPFEWERVHLFWVDERAVPPTDAQSNFKMALENFIAPANFPAANLHRVRAELPPVEAAQLYADEIHASFEIGESEIPVFDVIHRGLGPDAHTASLFPGEPLIEDRDEVAAAVWVAKMSQWRITLLPAVLLAARYTVVLAAGNDKAEAVRNIFNQPYDPVQYPSQLGLQGDNSLTWFLDQPAAQLLGDIEPVVGTS